MALIRREQIAGMNCHYYNYSLDYFFQTMEKIGYKTVALWGGAPHFFLDYMSYSDCIDIRRKAEKHGLRIECFTPSSGTYGYQMGMQPLTHRERVFSYYCNGLKAAVELGCSMISMNTGWGYWDEPFEEAWERSKEMIWRLCEIAEKENVFLTMESLRNAESKLGWNLHNMERMFCEIDHPRLKMMIDTTAIGVAGETLQQWFNAFGTDIVNTHFIDGTPYGHLVWGDGIVDLKQSLKVLKDNGYSGLLGLEITARQYYTEPEHADLRNMKALEKFL